MKTVNILHPAVYVNDGEKVLKLATGEQELSLELAEKLIARGLAVVDSEEEAKLAAIKEAEEARKAAEIEAKAARKAKAEEHKARRAAEDAERKAAEEQSGQ